MTALHRVGTVLWALAFPLLLLRGVRESVPFLAFCSVYANFVGHWSALEATKT